MNKEGIASFVLSLESLDKKCREQGVDLVTLLMYLTVLTEEKENVSRREQTTVRRR